MLHHHRTPRYFLRALTLLACAILLLAGIAAAAIVEPSIMPTVHPTLAPTSAIQVPLKLAADQTSVWRFDREERLLLSGRVNINVGYRALRADNAAVWLTPSRESGENTYDVAIYLAGNVQVKEGDSAKATTTVGKELLVTTRIAQRVQLVGIPVSKSEEDSPIVKRGNDLREELLNRPAPPVHIPPIAMTSVEEALQSGWIARGPNNRIIAAPGESQVVYDEHGNVIPGAHPAPTPGPPKPRPSIFITGDDQRDHQVGNEIITVFTGAYVFYDSLDGKPPLEFRAQRIVAFSPAPAGAESGPAATSAPATQNNKAITRYVTGVYFEGDVTVDQGDQLMVRSERIYYEFTTQRAIMLDATLATVDQVRNVPLYMRAGEIRQLARGEFAAKKATFSTSEFFTPHYHIGASDVYLRDVTPPPLPSSGAQSSAGGGAGNVDTGLSLPGIGGGGEGQRTYDFEAKNATLNVQGVPIFYWPFLAGDTSKNEIPLRTVRISNSRTYGLSILTDWDLFGLAGQVEPKGVHADLNLDYFGKRGPAGGVQGAWNFDDDHGVLRSYALIDHGTDRLGAAREDIVPDQTDRGRITVRDQRDLGDGLTLQLEGSYISDPTFLEEFFEREFDSDKEHETSIYLKKQGETSALTFLAKFNLMDFTSTADQVDDQFSTEKKPELKYWRIGDSLLDLFTYYSETGAAYLDTKITNFTPAQLGLSSSFLGPPASLVPTTSTYRAYYRSLGYTTSDVLRADTRQEIDLPLQIGDVKVTPYATGRFTFWDDSFPDASLVGTGNSGSTSRVWGAAGIRSSMQFWHVYNDAESTFFDVHRLRHVIEPQFNLFISGSNQDRADLQPFDRDVEGISSASGTQLAINQKWTTKRPIGPGPQGQPSGWRDVDWITLNISWNQFWNKDKTSDFFPMQPLRGYFFSSRPELSLVQDSINVDGTWRVGEHFRFQGEADYSLDNHRFEQAAAGIAVDQSPTLSYFFGTRYVQALHTDEWTIALDYQLTPKYQFIAAESYDFEGGRNILSSFTLMRHLPRVNTALTVTYDANNADTTVVFTLWPEGLPNTGFGTHTGTAIRP